MKQSHHHRVPCAAKRAFWTNAAYLYGVRLSDAVLDDAAMIDDDLVVIDRLFPQLADVERQELVWALGAHLASLEASASQAA